MIVEESHPLSTAETTPAMMEVEEDHHNHQPPPPPPPPTTNSSSSSAPPTNTTSAPPNHDHAHDDEDEEDGGGGGEDDDNEEAASSSAQPPPPPPLPATTTTKYKFSAHLKGHLDPVSRKWEGFWADTEQQCEMEEGGSRQRFHYRPTKRVGKAQSLEITSQGPSTIRMTGEFDLGTKSKAKPEMNVCLTFMPTSLPSVFDVSGSGKNELGHFEFVGKLDTTSNMLSAAKCYLLHPPPRVPVQKKPPVFLPPSFPAAAATNPILPSTTTTTTTSPPSTTSTNDPNLDKPPPRYRRTPSHLADSEVELFSKPSETDLSSIARVVDTLSSKDKNRFFQAPVDPVALGIPDYPEKIKNPMDLGTIKTKLAAHEYRSEDQVIADVRLVFSNAMLFNPPIHLVHKDAQHLMNQFEALLNTARNTSWRKRMVKPPASASFSAAAASPRKKAKQGGHKAGRPPKNMAYSIDMSFEEYGDEADAAAAALEDEEEHNKTMRSGRPKQASDEVEALKRQLAMVSNQVRDLQQANHHHKPARPAPKPKSAQQPSAAAAAAAAGASEASTDVNQSDRPLSYQEKRNLGQDIHRLPQDKVYRVLEIINESGFQTGGDDDEVEIDIEKLNTATLRKLQKFTRDVLRMEKKKMALAASSGSFLQAESTTPAEQM